MKKLKTLLLGFILIPLFSTASLASGVITISGKLVSTTETQYLIQTKKSVFFIQRRAIRPDVATALDKLGSPVTLTVPFEAITLIKSRKDFRS